MTIETQYAAALAESRARQYPWHEPAPVRAMGAVLAMGWAPVLIAPVPVHWVDLRARVSL